MVQLESLTKSEELISSKITHYNAFQFASIISSYPDADYIENINALFDDEEAKDYCSSINSESWDMLSSILNEVQKFPEKVDDIRSDYIDLFDRTNTGNSLYETEYGRDRIIAKTKELADISGFYKAFGLESESPGIAPEMVDHISVELEFYASLLIKQIYLEEKNDVEGTEIVLDARKKFLSYHLGRFVKAISERPGIQENLFFPGVFRWINSLIEKECISLDIHPDITEWLSNQKESEDFDCSASGCGIK